MATVALFQVRPPLDFILSLRKLINEHMSLRELQTQVTQSMLGEKRLDRSYLSQPPQNDIYLGPKTIKSVRLWLVWH